MPRSTHAVRTVGSLHPLTIKQKANAARVLAAAIAESIHEFLESGGLLDLEEDLVVVICDLDVEVLRLLGLLLGLVVVGFAVRHDGRGSQNDSNRKMLEIVNLELVRRQTMILQILRRDIKRGYGPAQMRTTLSLVESTST